MWWNCSCDPVFSRRWLSKLAKVFKSKERECCEQSQAPAPGTFFQVFSECLPVCLTAIHLSFSPVAYGLQSSVGCWIPWQRDAGCVGTILQTSLIINSSAKFLPDILLLPQCFSNTSVYLQTVLKILVLGKKSRTAQRSVSTRLFREPVLIQGMLPREQHAVPCPLISSSKLFSRELHGPTSQEM